MISWERPFVIGGDIYVMSVFSALKSDFCFAHTERIGLGGY